MCQDTTLALWIPCAVLSAFEAGLSAWCFVVGLGLRGLAPCVRNYIKEQVCVCVCVGLSDPWLNLQRAHTCLPDTVQCFCVWGQKTAWTLKFTFHSLLQFEEAVGESSPNQRLIKRHVNPDAWLSREDITFLQTTQLKELRCTCTDNSVFNGFGEVT